MGVNTLLKHLGPCLEDSHVERFRGKTVALDGNTFIFRGCYSCSEQVALGQACTGPVDHLMKRVHMLRHYGVKPWVVLDGRRTPMKDDTGKQRWQEREKNLTMAKHFRRQADDISSAGPERDALLQKAQAFFQKSIHVTRQMVTNAMSALKREGVECMVSPYEADAQVAFLVKSGLASAVITEDSDILVYMAAVKSSAPVLYKMDEFGGCKELGFDPHKLSSLPGVIGKFGRGLSAFSGEGGGRSFVQLAALAGCDYVDNIRGLGLLTALPIVTKFRRTPADKRVSHILMHVQKMGRTIPTGHRERMHLAEMSFFWHRVYDPRTKKCVHFCEAAPELVGTADVPALPSTAGGTAFLGEPIEDEMMVNISRGNVDPVTGEPVTAETFPASGAAGVRRAVTHQPRPGFSGQRRNIAPSERPRSATMPTTTPSGSKNQRNESGGARPCFPQQGQKQGRDWRGREAQVSVGKRGGGGGGGGGVLKDMFERARSRAEEEEKENLFSQQQKTRYPAPGAQDVSEIVLACGSGPTPGRRGRFAADSSPAPTAVPNPFARKPGDSAAGAAAAGFHTPGALTAAGARLRGEADALRPTEYGGGDPDAWSRLSKGCLTACAQKEGGEDSATRGAARAAGEGHEDCGARRAAAASSGTVSAAAEIAGVTPAAPKRPLSRGGSGSGRGKKAKLGVGGKAGPPRKGATMLSFFGRAGAVPKR